MSLRPFFPYFGGKFRLAPKYPKPRWSTIIEPFAGSAGYSLRYAARNIVLYDLNAEVFCTWRYLIGVSQSEILSLPLHFDNVKDLPICQEAKWLIAWWINPGVTVPRKTVTKWMKERPEQYWGEKNRAIIAGQVDSIRHWKIYNQSYESAPDIQATWFIDPPYQRSGANYPRNNINYERLKRWTKARRGQVMACGEHTDTWIEFEPFAEVYTPKGSKKNRADHGYTEMLWYRKHNA